MRRSDRKRVSLLLALLLVGALLPGPAAGANGVIRLDFEKEVVGSGVWSGTVDPNGGIRTLLTSVTETGNVWHVDFDWFVSETSAGTFAANVSGVLNLRTGRVALGGSVLDGVHAGSHIQVEAQLDMSDFSSEGTMTITP